MYHTSSNNKFFKEKRNNSHMDYTYGKDITILETKDELRNILKKFTELCSEKNIKPILMHGSLIGWYFNRKILPWDNDIDIVLIGNSIERLKRLDNFETEEIIIKINPNSSDREYDRNNKIDARVISKKNGVFIDITFLYQSLDSHFKEKIKRYFTISQNKSNPFMSVTYENKLKTLVRSINKSENFENTLFVNCKSPHYYNIKHILPLKKEKFEDCDIYIPNNIDECLYQEYGENVFKPKFRNWIYNSKKELWERYKY